MLMCMRVCVESLRISDQGTENIRHLYVVGSLNAMNEPDRAVRVPGRIFLSVLQSDILWS